jgi:hypothetical protein
MTPNNKGMKMSKSATNEYIKKTKERYSAMLTRAAKSSVLDGFCQTTEYDRKHAIKLLNGKTGNRVNKAGRKAKYGDDVKTVLKSIWLTSDQLCSKLLKPVIKLYLNSYEKNIAVVPKDVRKKLLTVSPATIDRLLQSDRVETAKWRRRLNKSSRQLKNSVPVRVGPWDVSGPGWLEADGVAHCDGSMAGNFIWTVTYVDIFSGWTEARATWNRSSTAVKKNTQQLMISLPFDVLGLDVDNGPEFLNWSIYRLCEESTPKITFTRSRPYHKNDNAHVEQRNWTHVRQLLGYERLEDPEMVELINDLYSNEWSLFKNLYCPIMKLVSKDRVGSKYVKKFDKPKTPCQRLLDLKGFPRAQKTKLRKLLKESDPYLLKQSIDKKLDTILNYKQKPIKGRAS